MASSRSLAETPLDLLVAFQDRALEALAEDNLAEDKPLQDRLVEEDSLVKDRLVEEDSLVKDKALLAEGMLEVPADAHSKNKMVVALAVYWTEVVYNNHLL